MVVLLCWWLTWSECLRWVKTSNLFPSRPVCLHFHAFLAVIFIKYHLNPSKLPEVTSPAKSMEPHSCPQEGSACWQCLVPDIHIYPGGDGSLDHHLNHGIKGTYWVQLPIADRRVGAAKFTRGSRTWTKLSPKKGTCGTTFTPCPIGP